MEGHNFTHHNPHHRPIQHQQQQQQQQMMAASMAAPAAMMGAGMSPTTSSPSGATVVAGGDRFPQWSIQETKEFLAIRSELDRTFMETKRNKVLWEVIGNKMREKGYNRSAEQCKCKWKNLVTRYKGCETMEPEAMRQQFPFYNELQSIFTARMQRMLWAEAEASGAAAATTPAGPSTSTGGILSRKKSSTILMSSDEDEDDDNNSEDIHGGETKHLITGGGGGGGGRASSSSSRKRKKPVTGKGGGIESGVIGSLKEMLDEFMRRQEVIEAEWRERYEAREEERRNREEDWRRRMEGLEMERLTAERMWREREEGRRVREEQRAEKRDALITALLNRLRRED